MRKHQTNPNRGICSKIPDQHFKTAKEERLGNCHRLEEIKKTRLKATEYPVLDPGTEKGH